MGEVTTGGAKTEREHHGENTSLLTDHAPNAATASSSERISHSNARYDTASARRYKSAAGMRRDGPQFGLGQHAPRLATI